MTAPYDARVELLAEGHVARRAFAVVKRTFVLGPRGWEPGEPVPLEGNFHDREGDPALPLDTDFWPHKRATDVIVRGSAHAPGGRPTERMTVGVRVGRAEKRVAVFGRRLVEYRGDGTVRFTAPEPFTEMPVDYRHAYGGIDFRVRDEELAKEPLHVQALAVQHDHPGLYPRNPFGKGYIVEPGALEGVELPELEDPGDLLTPERFLVRDPRRWYLQPLPCALDRVHAMMFPRYLRFAAEVDAWYPGPEDERMPEVRRGMLPAQYRSRRATGGMEPAFQQDASHGLVLRDVVPGTPVAIEGMHPERPTVTFAVPRAPVIEGLVDGRLERLAPRLHHLVCEPATERVSVVWGVDLELPRAFVPKIHRHIPVAIRVDGDRPVAYDAPVPIRELVRAGMEAEKRSAEEIVPS